MQTPILTPYATLEPEVILTAVESVGFQCTGSLLALNSYENRVYQVGIEAGEPWIVKFYRPQRWSDAGILEEHQFAWELAHHDIPIVAPWLSDDGQTLFSHQGFRFSLYPRKGGRALELDQLEHLAWMGRFIGRLHAIGACRDFQHRPTLDVHSYGYLAYETIMASHFIPAHLESEYQHAALTALTKVERCFAQVPNLRHLRLHGDTHAGNVLWRDSGPHLVDLDDCLMGPAIQDLWMLLSGDAGQMAVQLHHILQGYDEFYEFDRRELRLIEALRTLRLLHYSAWLAKRWSDPAFPLHFAWFDTPHYWQQQCLHLQEQSLLLDQVIIAGG